jgi:phospholipase C
MRPRPFCLFLAAVCFAADASAAPEGAMPRYEHVFVIVEENHSNDQVVGSGRAPGLDALAWTYGFASRYYAITHPSEPNYVAMIGGDTFGITDDDAFYCKPGLDAEGCENSDDEGYPDHTIHGPGLHDQIAAQGLAWKGYFEDIDAPGSLNWLSPEQDDEAARKPEGLYAAKHNPFMNFVSVQADPRRHEKIVGFDRLLEDIDRGALPNFAFIVPNQCNDMHGMMGSLVPNDCFYLSRSGLIRRADQQVTGLVERIMASKAWTGPGHAAIVITFDENDGGSTRGHPDGCCGFSPDDPSHPGGGWIATIVITNHGPRGLVDPTPYNHYSLLRTISQAFGIAAPLRHAADVDRGVVAMTPLFAVEPAAR